ncbi:MAG TPA: permease prefix domain 2-containing transporter, partial [Longimicrobiales bacterium]|nr:permease prefix domain 2-containing transporter [Longimicrobiales bacterium]
MSPAPPPGGGVAAPPRLPRRLLERALQGDPAAAAILGDLHEDFVTKAAESGAGAARRWYAREAVGLAAGRLVRRALSRPRGGSGSPGLRGLAQDAGFALRVLRRSPAFSLFTAGIIARGGGAATAVFSVLQPLVLAGLPFEDS